MILETYEKQPAEVQDYDIDFNPYLEGMGLDTALNHVVEAPAGITIVNSILESGVVKVFVSGGENGKSYLITVRITTAGGRVREVEIKIKVKEY